MAKLAHSYQVEGLSLDRVARQHTVPRSAVERALREYGVPKRGPSEAHRMRHAKMTPQERQQHTSRARDSYLHPRRPRGRQAHAVVSWCHQALPAAHQACAQHFRQRGVQVQAMYPAGPHNIYLAVPNALLAIEVVPRRRTHANTVAFAKKVSYLLSKGWFVTYLSDDPMVHMDSIVGLAKVRSGACLDPYQRQQMRNAMQPFVDQLHAGHRAAVAMAEAILKPDTQSGQGFLAAGRSP